MSQEIYDKYWSTSNRKKNWLKENELGPNQFQKWGSLNNIKEKSLVLADLIKVGNTDGLNHQYVFKTVLDQLGLNFKTHDITPDSKNKGLKIVCYEVESTPRWGFSAFASTRAEALAEAAKKGLEFFMLLADV